MTWRGRANLAPGTAPRSTAASTSTFAMFDTSLPGAYAAGSMNRMYRRQRHIYDFTRKFYLLGRDRLIDGLAPPAGARVLEVGCGTGRNLIRTAWRRHAIRCYGIDISEEMLSTARVRIGKTGLRGRIAVAQGDA